MVNERQVLTTLVLHWRINGHMPTTDELCDYLQCTPAEITTFTEDEEFQNKMKEKGLPVGNDNLSPRQIQAITMVFNPSDGRNLYAKLAEAEIDADTWNNWMKQPQFRRATETISAGNISDSYPLIMEALLSKALSGNQRSIEYLMEVTGRYRKSDNEVNPMLVMSQLLEILSKKLGNQPELLLQISDELDRTIIKGELA